MNRTALLSPIYRQNTYGPSLIHSFSISPISFHNAPDIFMIDKRHERKFATFINPFLPRSKLFNREVTRLRSNAMVGLNHGSH